MRLLGGGTISTTPVKFRSDNSNVVSDPMNEYRLTVSEFDEYPRHIGERISSSYAEGEISIAGTLFSQNVNNA